MPCSLQPHKRGKSHKGIENPRDLQQGSEKCGPSVKEKGNLESLQGSYSQPHPAALYCRKASLAGTDWKGLRV